MTNNFITICNPNVFGDQSRAIFQSTGDQLPSTVIMDIGGTPDYQITSPPVVNGGTIKGSFILFGIQQTVSAPIIFDNLQLPIRFPFGANIVETNGNNVLIKKENDIFISTTFLNNLKTSHASDQTSLISSLLTFDVTYIDGTVNHCSFKVFIHVFGPIFTQTSDLLVAPLGHALQIQFKGGKPPFEYSVNDGLYVFSSNSRSVTIQDPDNIFSSTTSVRIYDAWYNLIQKILENYILSLKAALPNPLPILFPNDVVDLSIDASTTDLGLILNHYAALTCPLGKVLPSDFNSAAFLPVNYLSDTGVKDTTASISAKVERALVSYLSDITLPIAPKNPTLVGIQDRFFKFINDSKIVFGRLSRSWLEDPQKIMNLYNVVQPYVLRASDKIFARDYPGLLSEHLENLQPVQQNLAVQHSLLLQSDMTQVLLTELVTILNYSDSSDNTGNRRYDTSMLDLYVRYNLQPSSTRKVDNKIQINTNLIQLRSWRAQLQILHDNVVSGYNAKIASDEDEIARINTLIEQDRLRLANIVTTAKTLFQSDFRATQVQLSAELAAWAPLQRALALQGIDQRLTRIASFNSMVRTNSLLQSDAIPLVVPHDIPAQTVHFSDFIVFAVNRSYDQGSYIYQAQNILGGAEICRVDTLVSDDMCAYQTNQTKDTWSNVYMRQETALHPTPQTTHNSDLINFLLIKGTFQTQISGNFTALYSLQYHCTYNGYALAWSDNKPRKILKQNELHPLPTSPLFKEGGIQPRYIKISGPLFRDSSDDLISNFIEFSDCYIALNYQGDPDRTIKTFPFLNQIRPGVLQIPIKRLFIHTAILPEFIIPDSYCPLKIPVMMSNLSAQTYLKLVLHYRPQKILSYDQLSMSDNTITVRIPTPKESGSYRVDMYLVDPTDQYAVTSDSQWLTFNPLEISNYRCSSKGVLGIDFPLFLNFTTNEPVNATLIFNNVPMMASLMTQNKSDYQYGFRWTTPDVASDYVCLLQVSHPHYPEISKTFSDTIQIVKFVNNFTCSVPQSIMLSEETLPIAFLLDTVGSDIGVSAQIRFTASDNSGRRSDLVYDFSLDISDALGAKTASLVLSDIDYTVQNWVVDINLFTVFSEEPFVKYSKIVSVKPLTISLEPYAFLIENALVYDVSTNASQNSRIKQVSIEIIPQSVPIPTFITSVNFANTSVPVPLSDLSFLDHLSDHAFVADFVINGVKSTRQHIRVIQVLLDVNTLSDSYLAHENLTVGLSLQILNGSGNAQIQATVDGVTTTLIISDTENQRSINMPIVAPGKTGRHIVTIAVQDLFYNDYTVTKNIELEVFAVDLSDVRTAPTNLYVNKVFQLTFDVDKSRFPEDLSYYVLWNDLRLDQSFTAGKNSLQITAPSAAATYPLSIYGSRPGHSDTLLQAFDLAVKVFAPSTAGVPRSVAAGSTIQLGTVSALKTEVTYTWFENPNTSTISDAAAYPTTAIPLRPTTYTVITQSTIYSDLVGSQSVRIDAEPYNLSDIIIFPSTPIASGGYVTVDWVITSKSDDINTTIITVGDVSDVFVHRGPQGSATILI